MEHPTYHIRHVAELSALSPHVIRIWERRYGILAPQRANNGYRLYTEEDVQLLLYLKTRIQEGMSIGQLAHMDLDRIKRAMTHTPIVISGVQEDRRPYVLPIIQCARSAEYGSTRTFIHDTAVQLGIERAVLEVFFPVLRIVGNLWHRGELSSSGEQTISIAIRQELVEAIRQGPSHEQGIALVSCVPNEYHEIGAMTSALFLKIAGVASPLFGTE